MTALKLDALRPSLCIVLTLLVLSGGRAAACTVFRLDAGDGPLVGRNYDWNVDDGLVLVNKRHVAKTFDLTGARGGAGWTSRYGSLTFNQYGRDLPQGGVNEKGLVVEILWLSGTRFPPPDDRPALETTQWIQYQLDMSATVDDVIASLDRVRIASQIAVHFFVSDRSGRSASVEFLDGRPVIHTGDAMPAPVLANHSYEASLSELRRHEGWGGTAAPGQGTRSLNRFVRAATAAREYDPERDGRAPDFAFEVLDDVAQGAHTKWTIVYDLRGLRVGYRTHRQGDIKTVDLDDLDFDCESPVMMADVNAGPSGDGGPRWSPYTRAANLELVSRSYARTSFLADTSPSLLETIADYPERSSCAR